MIAQLVTLYVLIRHFEGCFLMPYICPAGVYTCGWGSTGHDVFPGRPWSQDYADRRMEMDAARFAKGVVLVCPALGGDALCGAADCAYNIGLGAFRASTLARKLAAGDYQGARREYMKWVHGGGRVLPGLVLRRSAEAALLP